MIPYVQAADFTLYQGDALGVLRELPGESVHCVVTSPPYWGLRDYGTGSWICATCDGSDEVPPGCTCPDCHGQGEPKWCDHSRRTSTKVASVTTDSAPTNSNHEREGWKGGTCGRCGARRVDSQLGLEATPEEYVDRMVAVFAEVRRVLRSDGTCWLNIGDSYVSDPGKGGSGTPNGRNNRGEGYGRERMAQVRDGKAVHDDVLRPYAVEGLRPKNLVGVPWRLAFALQEDGWYLRSEIIWHKPNPMPESVTDRPTKAHEQVFLLTKSACYFYDKEAIEEAAQWYGPNGMPKKGPHAGQMRERAGKNPTWGERKSAGATRGNVAFGDNVGAGTQRGVHGAGVSHDLGNGLTRNARSVWTIQTQPHAMAHFAVFPEELARRCIAAGSPANGVILDPFAGSGTTALVARRLGRSAIGIELSAEYCELCTRRVLKREISAMPSDIAPHEDGTPNLFGYFS